MTNIGPGLLFDASVDLTPYNTPPGIDRAVAIELVTKAVEAMPGARSAGVEWYDDIPPALPDILIIRASKYFDLDVGDRNRLAELVRQVVRKTLFTGPVVVPARHPRNV